MRKQYHFRKSGRDILIWDINRLILRTQHHKIIDLPLEEVRELDEAFWYNSPSEIPTCRSIANHAKLIHNASLDHPVIICPEGRIMDGMHRVCKAFNLGMATIKAKKLDILPAPDFINVPAEELPYEESNNIK